jgi:membrane protease YdiL (CAAX protease family)
MKKTIMNKLLASMATRTLKEMFLYLLILPAFLNVACSFIGSLLINSTPENSMLIKDFLGAGYPPLVYVMFVILTCLAVPFIEEVVFRKWLWAFVNKFLNTKHTLWFTSVAFAFLHGGWYGLVLLPFALYLGYIRKEYGSFKFSTVPHVVFNTTGVLLTLGGI